MKLRNRLIVLFTLMAMPLVAIAQPAGKSGQGQNQQGGGSSGGGGGPVDPARFKMQILEGIKGQLAGTEEEWTKLLPKIEKVLDAQRATRTGAGMSFNTGPMVNGKRVEGGTRVQGGGGANVDTPAGKAMHQIRTAIDKEASDDELRAKIAAMREARDKSREELTAAQKELREACSTRQEAALLTLGTLE